MGGVYNLETCRTKQDGNCKTIPFQVSLLVTLSYNERFSIMHRILLFLGLALSGLSEGSKCGCSDVSFKVPVTSQNLAFSSPPNMNNNTDIINFLQETWRGNFPAISGTVTVSDTFTIKGTYCVPKKAKANTLEVLVHGVTYNKDMWAGLGLGSKYDWHNYANKRGYATLAIDRLGHGDNPQHPDPLNIVQPQVQVDILHQILTAVRSPRLGINALPRTYEKVVLVGHSFGSFLGAALAAQHPADADALVLTAYSSYVDFTAMATTDWAIAAAHNPSRFEGLPSGYLTTGVETQRTAAFFGPKGSFDPAVARVDFARQDTIALGETAGLPAIIGSAEGYKGKVLVVTAVNDGLFCEAPREKCEGHLKETGAGFPDAKVYDFFAPEETGHDLTLHYSARRTFSRVHDWLDEKL